MEARDVHALSAREVARALDSDTNAGLTTAAASQRLARYGSNRPRRPQRPPYARLLLNELLDPLVLLLVAATVISVAIGDVLEGAAIAAILVLNAALGSGRRCGRAGGPRAFRGVHADARSSCATARAPSSRPRKSSSATSLFVGEGDRVAADARVARDARARRRRVGADGRVAAG